MNREQQDWLDALRSDKYKQCRTGHLRHGDTFCCLGVALDILDPNGWLDYEKFTQKAHVLGRMYSNHIDTAVAKTKFNLSFSQQEELVGMNDTGVPFTKIADVLEGWFGGA